MSNLKATINNVLIQTVADVQAKDFEALGQYVFVPELEKFYQVVSSTDAEVAPDYDFIKPANGDADSIRLKRLYKTISGDVAWTTYSPTIGGGVTAPTLSTGGATPAQVQAKYKYNEDTKTLSLKINIHSGDGVGAAAGSGVYLIPLPSGFQADTTISDYGVDNLGTGNYGDILGSAWLHHATVVQGTAHSFLWDASNIYVIGYESGANSNAIYSWGSWSYDLAKVNCAIMIEANIAAVKL